MESTYCTVAEVTTYAAANGELHWSQLSAQDLTGAINNASGYLVGDTSITVDGFADDVQRITAGSVFTIASDSTSTEHTILSTKYDSGTVEISFTPGLAEKVADNDVVNIQATEATAFQIRCVVQACRDIVRYHAQRWSDGTLWLETDALLKKANIIQALYLARVFQMRDSAENISALTGGSYSDGVVSIETLSAPGLCPDAQDIVATVLRENKDILMPKRGIYAGR
ncbi:MAG TPA: hypothetical protein PLF85_13070 [Turneriella sp.]|nr:hypothetical protein [Turneriella sp.]